MSRGILIYGQSGQGKTYSLKNLNPDTTLIIDADQKNTLCWRGWKSQYSLDKKNFVPVNSIDRIIGAMNAAESDPIYKNVTTVVIDGITNALTSEELRYSAKNNCNPYEKFDLLRQKGAAMFETYKRLRKVENVILIGNVKSADPRVINSVDCLFMPSKWLNNTYNPESHFTYVFYAKKLEDGYVFETQANQSTAKSPEGCFDLTVPNDVAAIISQIDKYEAGELND